MPKTFRKPLSRFFPAYHPRASEPTYFVEKLYNSIFEEQGDWSNAPGDSSSYVVELNHLISEKKHHTIRAGNKVKVGDFIEFYVWSGKPYRSKQIVIAPPIEVKKVGDFEISCERNSEMRNDFSNILYINRKVIYENEYKKLAANDGLSVEDFCNWFKIELPGEEFIKQAPFTGQIICWSDSIVY